MSKYATFENNAPKYAPYAVQIGSHTRVTDSLTEAEANGVGLKLVVDTPPETDAQHYAAPTGWTDGDRITRTYEIREVEVPPTSYKVEEIIYGLIEAGALQAVKGIVGDYWELLTMRDTIDADNEIFVAKYPELRAAIIAAGILTEAQLDAILAASVAEA